MLSRRTARYSFPDCTEVRPTVDRGKGLFATQDIEIDTKIIEYCGEVKKLPTWNRDKVRYIAEGIVDNYAVQFGERKHGPKMFVVDATRHGNNARFANHSHTPNCTLEEVSQM